MTEEYKERIEILYLSLYDKLMVYGRCAFQNEGLAEEAIQDTFRIACMKPQEVCESSNPEGWIVNTLKHIIANTKRNRMTANRILTEYISIQVKELAVSEDQLEFSLMYEEVAELEEYRLIREMIFEGKSHLELARERGISVAACRKRVQRAKEILRKKILD